MPLFRRISFTTLLTFSTFVNAALINKPPSLVLTYPDARSTFPNASLASEETISSPSDSLPPSPYTYLIPNDPTTRVIFSAYASPITELDALQCLLAATEDVEAALEAALRDADPDRLIPQRYFRIDAEHVLLSLAMVDGQMKWITWGRTLKALTRFLYRWEFVGLRFVVEEEGVRVGVGVLAKR